MLDSDEGSGILDFLQNGRKKMKQIAVINLIRPG